MTDQLDYIFFFYGLSFILLAAVCFSLSKTVKPILPWRWLAGFGLVHGINEWLDMLAFGLGDSLTFQAVRVLMMASSFVFLVEFGRRSTKWITGKTLGAGVTGLLIVLACSGWWIYGMTGLNVMSRYSLGFVGGAWTAFVFVTAYRISDLRYGRRSLFALGIVFFVYAISCGLVVPQAPFAVASLLNQDVFMRVFGFPVQLLRGAMAASAGVLIWRVLQAQKVRTNRAYAAVFSIMILAVLTSGWVFVQSIGAATKNEMKERLRATATLSASTVRPETVRGFDPSRDADTRRYQILKQRLEDMNKACPHLRHLYILLLRDGQILFCAESEPETSMSHSPPGEAYVEAPPEIGAVFHGRLRSSVVEYKDRWGHWVSAFVPIVDDHTGEVLAVLGMDLPHSLFAATVARQRMLPIIITLLVAVLMIAFYAAYEKQRESFDRLAMSETELRDSESFQRTLMQGLPIGVVVINAESRVIERINAHAANMFGASVNDIVDRRCHQFLCPACEGACPVCDLEQEVDCSEREMLRADGERLAILKSVKKIRLQGQEKLLECFIDISDRKEAERELLRTKDELESFFLVAPDLFCIANLEGRFVRLNAAWENIMGYSLGELQEQEFMKFVHEDDRSATIQAMSSLASGYGISDFVNRYRCKDGTYRWIEWHSMPANNGLIYAAARDVTKRVEMEAMLADEREHLSTTLRSIGDGVISVDLSGRITFINPIAEELTGWDSASAIGLPFSDVFHAIYGPTRERIDSPVDKVIQSGIPMELEEDTVLLCRDGSERDIADSCAPIRNSCGDLTGVVLVFRDVTERKLAEKALRTEKDNLSAIFASSPVSMLLLNENTVIVDANDRLTSMVGSSLDEVVGCRGGGGLGCVHSTEHEDGCGYASACAECPLRGTLSLVLQSGTSLRGVELQASLMLNGEEQRCWLRISAEPVSVNGRKHVILAIDDITERKKTESQIRLHSVAINAADDPIAILDYTGRIVFANNSFKRQSGWMSDEIVGRELSDVWSHAEQDSAAHGIWTAIGAGVTWSGEMPCREGDGSIYTADVTITPLSEEGDHPRHLILIARNITERKEYEGLLDYKAHHDDLTGLPNRLLFSKELATTVSSHREQRKKCAVLFIDLDKFKMVNDTLGHQAGDELLVEAASRLQSCLRQNDILARMGGDEFTVILKNLRSLDNVAFIAQRMLSRISEPFEIAGSKLVIGASIGVSVYPDNAGDVDGLLKSADTAMYRAKDLGRNNCQFFSDELSQANQARLEMERDLRLAIERNEMKIYYQPIIDVKTMQVAGAEALIRWEHPEKGAVSPSLFVPIAEETGLVTDIGRMALRDACRECKRWRDAGYEDFQVSVNVSPVQLGDIGFISEVDGILTETKLPPQSLVLEVTENTLAKNENDEVDILSILRSLGVKICLDDFGIGYSSLSRLNNLPIAHMKIDGYFTRNIEHSRKDRAMTESMIVMAHNLGIGVTAEWIEDDGQLAIIRMLGCDYAQGFLISPAMPAEAFESFMTDWASDHHALKAA